MLELACKVVLKDSGASPFYEIIFTASKSCTSLGKFLLQLCDG